ncbi:MAG: hypothetical protein CMJ86_05745 [Planctomycetes bacterium]|nr:hypothetical protein [Planctomycetota bacterium]
MAAMIQNFIHAQSSSATRVIAQALVAGANALVAFVTIGAFGSAVFGGYAFYLILAILLRNLMIAVFVEPATAISAELEPHARRKYFTTLSIAFIAILLLSALPLAAALGPLANLFLTKPESASTALATLLITSNLFLEVQRAALQAFAAPLRILAYDSVRTVLSILALLVCVKMAPDLASFSKLNLLMLGQSLACLVVAIPYTLLCLSKAHWGRFRSAGIRRHRQAAKLTTPITVLRTLQLNTPIFWAQYLLGEEVVGVVRALQNLANLIAIPVRALRLRIMTLGSARHLAADEHALSRFILSATLKMTALATSLGLCVFGFAKIWPNTVSISGDQPEMTILLLYIAFNITVAASTTVNAYFYAGKQLGILFSRFSVCLVMANVLAPLLALQLGGVALPLTQLIVALFGFSLSMSALLWKTKRNDR